MRKRVKLTDQSEILIREMTQEDLARSLAFFELLSDEDRAYLRRGRHPTRSRGAKDS